MIVEMARIRVLGPRAALARTIAALQDVGVLHVVDATCGAGVARVEPDAVARRRRRHVLRALGDVDLALEHLAHLGALPPAGPPASVTEAAAARLAARLVQRTAVMRAHEHALAEERDALRTYEPLFTELETLLGGRTRRVSVFLLRLRGGEALTALRTALDRVLGGSYDLRTHALASGETIVLLLLPAAHAEAIERQLAEARIERAPLPAALRAGTLADALPRMRPRLAEVQRELAALRDEATLLARTHGATLLAARSRFHDALLVLEVEAHAAASTRAFVLEGWVPARAGAPLAAALTAAVAAPLVVEEIDRQAWSSEDAPVVLSNPRLFAPFEALTSLLPLPRYGTVDPTPFVAVFFPMLFGVVVGDLGYGAVIALIALVLRLTSRPGGAGRTVAHIAAAVAVYTLVFGALYGEAFGDLGEHHLGLQPLWFDRQEAVLAFLALAVALGVVHLVLGLILAAASRWRRHRREAIGRGLTALMLLLVVVALLAVFETLPPALLTPAVIALLVALPVVVILEGATALLDFMTILGHVLSYARVMALGTASVMLAVVANRMVGAFGSVTIGVAFALLFHLVNFAITLFSPTIHVMRLHYVEFFGTFFEPGGGSYRPLRHWSPEAVT